MSHVHHYLTRPTSLACNCNKKPLMVPTRYDSMEYLSPGNIVKCHTGECQHHFSGLVDHTRESPWGDTWVIRTLGQEDTLEVGEDLITPSESPYQIPTNLEDIVIEVDGADLAMEDVSKLWPTKNIVWPDEKELLVCHHRLNHCTFKAFIIFSKRDIIPSNTRKIKKPPPSIWPAYLGSTTRHPGRTRAIPQGYPQESHQKIDLGP